MFTLQRTGYRPKSLIRDIGIGVVDGIDSSVWSYTYATIIFAGALSVFLPLGLIVVLGGWALASLFVIATSRFPLHMVNSDEQAVVIFGTVGVLLTAHLGADVTSAKGISTMLAVMGITSFIVAASFYLVARLKLSHILEMVPYPVVCGFMVGVVWLYLDAGISIATGTAISPALPDALRDPDNVLKLAVCFFAGGALYVAINRFDSSWTMPCAIILIVGGFYLVTGLNGASRENLIAGGWLFDIDPDVNGAGKLLGMLSFAAVDVGFIVSVLPQIAAIVFLATLTTAMDLSILKAMNYTIRLRTADEMKNNGGANVLCGLLCSAPAHSDAITSQIYRDLGASSRWLPIASSCVLLSLIPFGTQLITYVPVVMLVAMIFMFAFQMFHDWMYVSMRELGNEDRAIILVILATVIAFGFVEGVLLGLLVTALLFVLRYSFISAIHGEYGLDEFRSSVERSSADNSTLGRHADEARLFTLRGFLFFGTSNAIRDALSDPIVSGTHLAILLDLRRVTGIDGSALQVFRQIKQLCDAHGIELAYSGVPAHIGERLRGLGAVSERDGEPLIFANIDFGVEWLEDEILGRHAEEAASASIDGYLEAMLDEPRKAGLVRGLLERVEVAPGDSLFRQDDTDDGLYILESGAMTALIDDGANEPVRVKKFSPGSLIGELSGYTERRKRTASVVADEPSVLYHLDVSRAAADPHENGEAMSAVHEMVARALSVRLDYMNRRLMKEIA